MTKVLYDFISGGTFVACWVVSIFFFKFQKKTQDRFFLYFSFSFFLLGLERIVLVLLSTPTESIPPIYLIRLLAFVIIIAAIVDKNRIEQRR